MVRDVVEMKPRRGNKGEVILRSRIKSVSKLACAQLLCDVVAWKAPTEIIHETGAERLAEAEKRAASVVSALDRSGKLSGQAIL